MARTKHTDPDAIRAQRRLNDPRGRRGDDTSLRSVLKELGVPESTEVASGSGGWPLPRIRRSRPRPGYTHPAEPSGIRPVLRAFGPTCVYGLRGIELRQVEGPSTNELRLATLQIPGTIVMFEQPVAPWTISGHLAEGALDRIARAGGLAEAASGGTTVAWPGDSLRDLMLFDGLFHEIGHHLIQQYEGKRSARKMRTSDHERRAEAFARACRARWSDPTAS